jgi:hypothetical protein
MDKPLIAFTGWEVRGGKGSAAGAVEEFGLHAPSGTDEARYELLAVAGRGFHPPRLLRTVGVGAEASDEEEATPPGCAGLRATWTAHYRFFVETAPATAAVYAVYLLGVNPPEGATAAELAAFDEFYTTVHLPEVAARRQALRAVRLELVTEVRAPHLGSPRYLALYEVDERGAAQRRHVGPPYTSGPPVWQGHRVAWRLWYRRLVGGGSATAKG